MQNDVDTSAFLTTQRRGFFKGVAAATAALTLPLQFGSNAHAAEASDFLPTTPTTGVATDEKYWDAIRSMYVVSPKIANLENGYFGIMANPVKKDFIANTERTNFENSFYARTALGNDIEAARQSVAKAVGAGPNEVAFSRNATEAFQMMISNYNKLKPGDQIIYADIDHHAAKYVFDWLQERRGVSVVKFDMPEPATKANVLDAYEKILKNTPKARLLLLTHLSYITGLVVPVAEIAAMAKKRGVDVILDSAHAFGQLDFNVKDLGVDFVAFNLHKWIGAPQCKGFMYIAENRLQDIDPAYNDADFPKTDIRSRIHTGTSNFAIDMTIPSAIQMHQRIGQAAKAARVRYLRDYWVSRSRDIKNLEILTPDEAGMSGAITSFRLKGKGSKEEVDKVVARLRDEFSIFTARARTVSGSLAGQRQECVRVTPAIFTPVEHVERFAAAIRKIAASS